MNGAGEPLGHRSINLLAACWRVLCLREVRHALPKHLARRPTLACKVVRYVAPRLCNRMSDRPRAARLVRSVLKPLEAHGRASSTSKKRS